MAGVMSARVLIRAATCLLPAPQIMVGTSCSVWLRVDRSSIFPQITGEYNRGPFEVKTFQEGPDECGKAGVAPLWLCPCPERDLSCL